MEFLTGATGFSVTLGSDVNRLVSHLEIRRYRCEAPGGSSSLVPRGEDLPASSMSQQALHPRALGLHQLTMLQDQTCSIRINSFVQKYGSESL